ncbi:MAG: hypothetical protein FWD16_03890 [Clostridia bacterium]|nr:hypothetical protein [Clostridia bacterium]
MPEQPATPEIATEQRLTDVLDHSQPDFGGPEVLLMMTTPRPPTPQPEPAATAPEVYASLPPPLPMSEPSAQPEPETPKPEVQGPEQTVVAPTPKPWQEVYFAAILEFWEQDETTKLTLADLDGDGVPELLAMQDGIITTGLTWLDGETVPMILPESFLSGNLDHYAHFETGEPAWVGRGYVRGGLEEQVIYDRLIFVGPELITVRQYTYAAQIIAFDREGLPVVRETMLLPDGTPMQPGDFEYLDDGFYSQFEAVDDAPVVLIEVSEESLNWEEFLEMLIWD